jgi:hypothetical protein
MLEKVILGLEHTLLDSFQIDMQVKSSANLLADFRSGGMGI